MILASNGGFWPQGVLFILWICATLAILYVSTQWLRDRIHRKLGKYSVSVLRIGLFAVSLLLALIVIGGLHPSDPNEEQYDRVVTQRDD